MSDPDGGRGDGVRGGEEGGGSCDSAAATSRIKQAVLAVQSEPLHHHPTAPPLESLPIHDDPLGVISSSTTAASLLRDSGGISFTVNPTNPSPTTPSALQLHPHPSSAREVAGSKPASHQHTPSAQAHSHAEVCPIHITGSKSLAEAAKVVEQQILQQKQQSEGASEGAEVPKIPAHPRSSIGYKPRKRDEYGGDSGKKNGG